MAEDRESGDIPGSHYGSVRHTPRLHYSAEKFEFGKAVAGPTATGKQDRWEPEKLTNRGRERIEDSWPEYDKVKAAPSGRSARRVEVPLAAHTNDDQMNERLTKLESANDLIRSEMKVASVLMQKEIGEFRAAIEKSLDAQRAQFAEDRASIREMVSGQRVANAAAAAEWAKMAGDLGKQLEGVRAEVHKTDASLKTWFVTAIGVLVAAMVASGMLKKEPAPAAAPPQPAPIVIYSQAPAVQPTPVPVAVEPRPVEMPSAAKPAEAQKGPQKK